MIKPPGESTESTGKQGPPGCTFNSREGLGRNALLSLSHGLCLCLGARSANSPPSSLGGRGRSRLRATRWLNQFEDRAPRKECDP